VAKKGKGKRKKKSSIDINVAVVVLVLLSILLMILIYTKAGSIGEILSPMLGGIMGTIKYVIPIGTLLIAIYMTHNDKEYLTHKLIQYGIFLLCVAAMLSICQLGDSHSIKDKEFSELIEQAYNQGSLDNGIGGGAIGAAIAVPLINALDKIGAIILTIGISIILLIFMFGIRPAEMISNMLDNIEERRNNRYEDDEEDDEEEKTAVVKETKKEKRLREKQEAEKLASQFENQLTINLEDDETDKRKINENAH